jgi:hypothetical protein
MCAAVVWGVERWSPKVVFVGGGRGWSLPWMVVVVVEKENHCLLMMFPANAADAAL